MLPNVGWPEMIILFVIVLIIFGPKSLPKIGQALGRGIREFKDAARGLTEMDDESPRNHTPTPVAPQVSQTPAAAATTTEQQTTEHHA
jgi:TatA/E family protein of Tat protein translocase